ncbi:MAG: alpha/beta fold hydrolase [Candidatus Lokiarchaeota archaeon]|nr:alpha/beta fold hydrolase [Candidatus Lokiarchaeota archaeon]
MEFAKKQYDGPFEAVMVELQIEDQMFKGIMYFPPNKFKRAHPIIIYFHGFPQLFTLQEIARNYQYLLEQGYALLIFNFRGYNLSDGVISIKNQVTDALKIIEFVNSMAKKQIIIKDDINILAHDFGGYIALITCSKINTINKLLMINPILDLKRHVKNNKFRESIAYINRFLPGYIKGISDVDSFIDFTNEELAQNQFNIDFFMNKVQTRDMKVIIGEKNKVTPIFEVEHYFNSIIKRENISIIKDMDHECYDEENLEVRSFFLKPSFN